MMVALSPASTEPAPPGARAPWLTRERMIAIRRPLTTLVLVVAGWEILARTVLTNRLFFAPPSDVALAAYRGSSTEPIQPELVGEGDQQRLVLPGLPDSILLADLRDVD